MEAIVLYETKTHIYAFGLTKDGCNAYFVKKIINKNNKEKYEKEKISWLNNLTKFCQRTYKENINESAFWKHWNQFDNGNCVHKRNPNLKFKIEVNFK